MTDRELLRELTQLRALPTSAEDWRDLYETIEAYQTRCLARKIAASPRRDALLEAIWTRAQA